MSFTPSGSPEFHDAVTNTVTSVIRSDADHNEMMRYIAELNKVRDDYKKLSVAYDKLDATCDAAFEIIKENEEKIGITPEEVNRRIQEHRAKRGAG